MTELVGTRVVIPGLNRGYGIVKYIGPIEGKAGTFAGIELDNTIAATRGKNNGDVDGVQYFDVAQPLSGLFLPWDRLRAANPRLPTDTKGGAASRDMLYTPSPPGRTSSLRFSSAGSFDSVVRSNGTGRESPFNVSRKLNLPKRHLSNKELFGADSHRVSSGANLIRILYLENQGLEALEEELTDARLLLEEKSRILREKNEILTDLQATVNDLNPLLEEYEKSLEDRDRRLKKQKHEYERAREEWRQSLDLMLTAQLETEKLYELKIEDLREEVTALKHKHSDHGGHGRNRSADFDRLLEEVEQLRAENRSIKDSAALQPSSKGEEDGEYVELLLKKIDMLTQDVSSMEIVMKDIQAKFKAKEIRIAELEIQLEEQLSKPPTVDQLLRQVEGMSISDYEEKEATFKKQIADIESQLQIALLERDLERERVIKFENTSPDTSASQHLLDQISQQEQDLTAHKAKAQSLETDLKSTQSQVQLLQEKNSQLIEKVESLNTRGGEDVMLRKTIEDLKHDLEMRPSFDELSELQNSLEEVDRLHHNEMGLKDDEISKLKQDNKKINDEILLLRLKIETYEAERSAITPINPAFTFKSNQPSPESGSLPDPESWAKNDALPIHTPKHAIDPSGGRDDWCGLCEREGHNSLNCPYENDIF